MKLFYFKDTNRNIVLVDLDKFVVLIKPPALRTPGDGGNDKYIAIFGTAQSFIDAFTAGEIENALQKHTGELR